MPPKRRGGQAKAANPATKAASTDPPKQPVSKPVQPAPPPQPPQPPQPSPPPPPPPQPVERGAVKVRKEWSNFMDAWYEPQKQKLVEKLRKELLVKYKNLGPAKHTQKQRDMELFEKLDSIAQQLAQPARAEWERRLDLAQLREDQWDDMTGEEQQAVMGVFVGFADDVDDFDNTDVSAEPSSVEEEDESIVEEPQYRGMPSFPSTFVPAPTPPSRHPIPPTPSRGNFEFVNPSSFFTESTTPPNPSKNLPALSMDHLATLGPSNAGRSADPASASVNGTLGFQNWASEVGIMTQQPQGQSPKPQGFTSMPTQTLSTRPRATDNMSRQASSASNLSSPPMKTSSPQYSPPIVTTKFSPPTNADHLPLGKRYIGPAIMEEEPDPLDEELLKSKMAEEFLQYKISLRIQMIYQFHAEAAETEIKLVETLSASEGTKESRARAVQDHEANMMRLRDQKEEERKRLCAEEREKRREEAKQQLAQRRPTQNREIDPGPKSAVPLKPWPDKTTSVQQRLTKLTHQKENVPVPSPAPAPPTMLEPPSAIKKSVSMLSQDEASANEAIFASAMAVMGQGKTAAMPLTSAQASLNESVFSNAAAILAAQGQPVNGSGKSHLQPPSALKKSTSSRSQDYDIPQITVSFAETSAVAPEAAPVPLPTTVKGKKGSRGQPAVQPPPAKPVVITEDPEMEMNAEPPPSTPSLWDAATVAAKNVWGTASSTLSAPKAKDPVKASVEEDREPEVISKPAPAPAKGSHSAKKAVTSAKKGKKVTIAEEPDADADPIISPPTSAKPKTTKGGWGAVNGKSKAAPPVVAEREPEPAPPVPPPATPAAPAWGKKPVQAAATTTTGKPQLKVMISEELEDEFERFSMPMRTNKTAANRTAWGAPVAVPTISPPSAPKKGTPPQQQAEPRRGPPMTGSKKAAHVETVPDPEDEGVAIVGGSFMPGALELAGPEPESEEREEEEERAANAWFDPENVSYWANFIAGQPEVESPVAPRAATEHAADNGHMLWTPTISRESDDEEEPEDDDGELATSMWVQYAISGGDIPGLGSTPEPPVTTTPLEHPQPQRDAGLPIWEQGKGKKMVNTTTADVGNRAQQTSVFDRAAFTGQWPKMETWLSPPARGQGSGSARVF